MTRQTHHQYGSAWRPVETLGAVLASLSRYDLALWAIPAAFLLAVAASTALSIDVRVALVGAALVDALVIADAIALNPPEPDP